MTNRNKELAGKVVKNFYATLGEKARDELSDSDLYTLAGMIEKALSVEKREIADLIEDMVKKLKADASGPDISM